MEIELQPESTDLVIVDMQVKEGCHGHPDIADQLRDFQYRRCRSIRHRETPVRVGPTGGIKGRATLGRLKSISVLRAKREVAAFGAFR